MASALLFVALFVPTAKVEAGFFSSLFGLDSQAYADSATAAAPENIANSQNISLLQGNVSLDSVLDDKNSTPKTSEIDPNSDINIVSDNAILPAVGPLGASSDKSILGSSPEDVSVYVVRKGDSLSAIAKMFDISPSTILWANDMKKGDKLVEGEVLFILPIDGVEHTVTKGQTLQSIAKLYKADPADIADYNDLSTNTKLVVGDKLIIPDGEMFDEGGDKPASNLKANEAKDKNYYALSKLTNIIGYFIDPLPTGHKTQGLHGPGHRGIDIGAPRGTKLYASAPGVVVAIKTGCGEGSMKSRCGGGYGNMVDIQHPNGTKTRYAHMSQVLVRTGAHVERGDVIGLVGNSGRSSGPHVHFEVFNAKNPGADWSWAN